LSVARRTADVRKAPPAPRQEPRPGTAKIFFSGGASRPGF